MICTDDAALAERCRVMALHGISQDAWKRYTAAGSWYYEIIAPGYKYNMTDLAAAMGLAQLHKAERMGQRRQEIAMRYHQAFAAMPELQIPADRADCQHAWHLYILRLQPHGLTISRDQFIAELKARNIGTSVHFIPLHLHPYYRETYGYEPADFPVAFNEFQRVVSLPIYSKMSEADVEDVIQAVTGLVSEYRTERVFTPVGVPVASGIKQAEQMAGALSPADSLSLDFVSSFLIRSLDLIASGLGLFLLAPIFLLIGLMIKLTSAGPVFYKAERIGQGGRPFKLYKFRSMVQDADRAGPAITTQDDPRITPVGHFLRRTKLDELPQLINVFGGEMSLVGPRPEDPRYVALYTPEQRQVLAPRPGMTSPASLRYREEETLLRGADWETTYREQILPHKLALDLAYLQQRTVWTDLALILQTIAAVTHSGRCLNLILKLRNRHFLVLDFLVLLFIPALALTLRLDRLNWWPQMGPALALFTLVGLLVKLPVFHRLGLYRRYWRYAGVNDLTRVLIAVTGSTVILTGLFIAAHARLEPYHLAMFRTVPLIDGLLTGLAVGGFRFGLRGLYHWQQRQCSTLGGRRVLIVGAGEAGTMVVREMQANPQLKMEPVAFVDDDPGKVGTQMQGLPVLGPTQQISTLVKQDQIQRIVVALPSASLRRQQELTALCRKTGVVTHSLPGVYQILAGYKTISAWPKFDLNQLLQREPIVTDQTEVAGYLAGATVLVTGAGGSIGSELCRQVARCDPKEVILLGHGENSIFETCLDLRLSFPDLSIHPVIVDVRDQQRVKRVVEKYRPDIIFHAAAHKHMHFMETNVEEAITNNILGTQNVLRAAEQSGVERFILISTDKAVNPVSIMGATKRMAELLVMAAARRSGRAYIAVRFGNVLGSRGSVLRVFQQQIAVGGPLTITHPDMRRYFMTISEAVQLVLQTSALGRGGEVFVLDMGQPVRIVDMATQLIKMCGLEPGRDIEIVYSGIRPGEKLNEKLFLAGEDYQRTKHSKIFVARPEGNIQSEALEQVVLALIELTRCMQSQNTLEQIQDVLMQTCYYIDRYRSQPPPLSPEPAVTTKFVSPSPGSLYPPPLPVSS